MNMNMNMNMRDSDIGIANDYPGAKACEVQMAKQSLA